MRWIVSLGTLAILGFVLAAEPKQSQPTVIAKPDAFKTLVNPNCSHCKDEAKRRAGDLKDDDRVLCWIRGKYDGGAIPYRFFLSPYRVISDTYGVFVYDADAGFVRGYEPSLDFSFYGWRNGVMVIQLKDGTLYSALSGVAFDGPGIGRRLKPIPTLESDWGYWIKAYADTVAYHMYDKYQPMELPPKPSEDSARTRPKADPRLPPDDLVLGVRNDSTTRAYPLSDFGKTSRVIHDDVGSSRIAVFWYAPTRTAAAYAVSVPSLEGKRFGLVLSFQVDEKNSLAPFVDEETGSRWDIAGRGIEGPYKGQTLQWVDGVQVKWLAWAAEYPETSVHGGK